MNNEANIMDMFYRSETKPRIRERLISREQYLEFLVVFHRVCPEPVSRTL